MTIRKKYYHHHLSHRKWTLIFIVLFAIAMFIIGFYYSTSLIQPYHFITN